MPKCLKSSVKYPQSVMVWSAMSAAGVAPLCFIKDRVNAASYQEILEHFILPSAEKLYGDEDFVFQHDLAPAHSANTTGKWFTDHGITVLNWPANSPDLNPIEQRFSKCGTRTTSGTRAPSSGTRRPEQSTIYLFFSPESPFTRSLPPPPHTTQHPRVINPHTALAHGSLSHEPLQPTPLGRCNMNWL